jgi:hypothetical protein
MQVFNTRTQDVNMRKRDPSTHGVLDDSVLLDKDSNAGLKISTGNIF